jgi:hypothetical protein
MRLLMPEVKVSGLSGDEQHAWYVVVAVAEPGDAAVGEFGEPIDGAVPPSADRPRSMYIRTGSRH